MRASAWDAVPAGRRGATVRASKNRRRARVQNDPIAPRARSQNGEAGAPAHTQCGAVGASHGSMIKRSGITRSASLPNPSHTRGGFPNETNDAHGVHSKFPHRAVTHHPGSPFPQSKPVSSEGEKIIRAFHFWECQVFTMKNGVCPDFLATAILRARVAPQREEKLSHPKNGGARRTLQPPYY